MDIFWAFDLAISHEHTAAMDPSIRPAQFWTPQTFCYGSRSSISIGPPLSEELLWVLACSRGMLFLCSGVATAVSPMVQSIISSSSSCFIQTPEIKNCGEKRERKGKKGRHESSWEIEGSQWKSAYQGKVQKHSSQTYWMKSLISLSPFQCCRLETSLTEADFF